MIAPVGLYIRSQLPETLEKHETHDSAKAVLWALLRDHWPKVLLGMFIICGGTVSTYIFNFMTTYAITTLHVCEKIATTLTFSGAIISMVGLAIGAWAADYFPRKPVLIITRLMFIAAIWPAWQILASVRGTGDCTTFDDSIYTLIGLNMVLNFLFSLGIGGVLRISHRSLPQARARKWPCHSLCAWRDDLRRHDAASHSLVDRIPERSAGAGLVSDRRQHCLDDCRDPARFEQGKRARAAARSIGVARGMIVDHTAWDALLRKYVKPRPDGSTGFAYGAVTAADKHALKDYIAAFASDEGISAPRRRAARLLDQPLQRRHG